MVVCCVVEQRPLNVTAPIDVGSSEGLAAAARPSIHTFTSLDLSSPALALLPWSFSVATSKRRV
ncbi:hypothetical protein ACN28E_31865 [Archangium lansingense]|uniref:hypothetical protein n=1 Tax=Archangium lansingense TaxID=2995310 RepID=UPI003B7A1264